MGVLERLAVIISGDDRGGVSAAERSAVAMEKAAVAQAKLTVAGDKLAVAQAKAAVVEAKAAGDAEALTVATTELTAAQERLAASTAAANLTAAQAGYAQAERSLQGVTKATQESTAASRLLGPISQASSAQLATGALVAVAAEEKLAKSFSDTTEETRKFRDVAGTTTQTADRFVATFKGLGIPVDTADTAVGRLAKTLGNTPDALDKFGVAIVRNKNGTVDLAATLLAIADRYNGLADPTQRAALAQAAFGRGYVELLPVLRANRDAVKEFGDAAARRGEAFTDADLRKGADFAIQMREAKLALEAVGHQLGGAAAGSFTDLARVVNTAASGAALLVHWMNQAKDAVDGWVARLIPHIPIVEKFARAVLGGSDAANTLATAADGAAGSIDGIADSAQKVTEVVDGLVGATRSYQSATEKITSANKQLADAHDEVAKKADDQAKATLDAQKANQDLTSAELALQDAQRKAPRDEARNRLDLASATLALKDARIAEKAAIERVSAKGEDAQKATIAREQAELALADAQDKVKAGQPQSVLDAELRVAEAKQRQADAAAAKTKADKEDPVTDIAKAEQAVKDATVDELIARGKLNDAIAAYNTQFQASVTLADVLDGKADDFLTTILQASTALGQANTDAATFQARLDAANQAAIGAGTVDADGTTLGPQDSTRANPGPRPGLLQRVAGDIINVTVNATTTPIDPNELGTIVERRIATAMRSRLN